MEDNFSLQGSILIKRLRTGQTVYLSLDSDKPLFQAVDTISKIVGPNWGQAANQPTITPSASAYSGEKVTLGDHKWAWNGTTLVFNGTAGADGFTPIKSGYGQGLFALGSGGRLKITGNIASTDNFANDTLTYTGDYLIETSKISGTISGDITIQIQKAGATSYVGIIHPLKSVLTTGDTEGTTIESSLTYGVYPQSTYTCKWYQNDRDHPISGQTAKTLKVTRDMVNGQTLFICDFFMTGSDEAVATDGCHITDMGDEFFLQRSYNNDLDAGKPTTAKAVIALRKTQTAASIKSASWDYKIYRVTSTADDNSSGNDSDFNAVVSGSSKGDSGNPGTCTVTVDTKQTEAGGLEPSDVVVWFNVDFTASLT